MLQHLFNYENISLSYKVKRICNNDIDRVLTLMNTNPIYFRYCPPFPSKDTIKEDMKALPPHKTIEDKYYLGLYEENSLVCIIDLILDYPKTNIAFIGFFMIDKKYQGKHIGTNIINELIICLRSANYNEIRLGYVEGNNEAQSFWNAMGFYPTGVIAKEEKDNIIVMKKEINK